MIHFIWAVHIADGFLAPAWLLGGYALAGALAVAGAWRVRDEEIPRIALLTAVFFVASQIHVSLGPSTAHLLLNGLLGIVLGRRVLLAIPLGLCLQAVLFGHGGYTTLGINACIIALPAWFAWCLFSLLRRISWTSAPAARSVLVIVSSFGWILCVIYAVALLAATSVQEWTLAFHLGACAAALALSLAAAVFEWTRETTPEFSVGLCVGELTVLLTLGLHCIVLLQGSKLPVVNGAVEREAEQLGIVRANPSVAMDADSDTGGGWRVLALVEFLVHLPIAALEGLIVGFLISFIARVKPEMIGATMQEPMPCRVESPA